MLVDWLITADVSIVLPEKVKDKDLSSKPSRNRDLERDEEVPDFSTLELGPEPFHRYDRLLADSRRSSTITSSHHYLLPHCVTLVNSPRPHTASSLSSYNTTATSSSIYTRSSTYTSSTHSRASTALTPSTPIPTKTKPKPPKIKSLLNRPSAIPRNPGFKPMPPPPSSPETRAPKLSMAEKDWNNKLIRLRQEREKQHLRPPSARGSEKASLASDGGSLVSLGRARRMVAMGFRAGRDLVEEHGRERWERGVVVVERFLEGRRERLERLRERERRVEEEKGFEEDEKCRDWIQ